MANRTTDLTPKQLYFCRAVVSGQTLSDWAVVASSLSDRERVLDKLRYLMDHALPSDSTKVRAAELLGKTIGLFKEVQVQQVPRTVEEVQAELDRRLAMYLNMDSEADDELDDSSDTAFH